MISLSTRFAYTDVPLLAASAMIRVKSSSSPPTNSNVRNGWRPPPFRVIVRRFLGLPWTVIDWSEFVHVTLDLPRADAREVIVAFDM